MADQQINPEMILERRNLDPRTRNGRIVPLQILVLSMPQTGTTSVQAALEILGYGPTMRGSDPQLHTEECKMWIEGLQAKYFPCQHRELQTFSRTEFDQLLGDCSVVSEFPSIAFAEELIAAYPEAKIIIVQRDVFAWYESFHSTWIEKIFDPFLNYVLSFDEAAASYAGLSRWWARGKFRATTKKEFEENAYFVYLEHYEIIRRIVLKERLLDFKIRDSWGPLCRFLGKKIPEGVSFPRIDDKEGFTRRSNVQIRIAIIRLLKRGVVLLGGVGAILVGIWFYSP